MANDNHLNSKIESLAPYRTNECTAEPPMVPYRENSYTVLKKLENESMLNEIDIKCLSTFDRPEAYLGMCVSAVVGGEIAGAIIGAIAGTAMYLITGENHIGMSVLAGSQICGLGFGTYWPIHHSRSTKKAWKRRRELISDIKRVKEGLSPQYLDDLVK